MLEKFVWLRIGLLFGMPLGWLAGTPSSIWSIVWILFVGCVLLFSRLFDFIKRRKA